MNHRSVTLEEMDNLKNEAEYYSGQVQDVSSSLLSCLSCLERATKASRISAESTLLAAVGAQTTFLQSYVKSEREQIEKRATELNKLERAVSQLTPRADIDVYVTLVNTNSNNSTSNSDSDDGGVASSMALLHMYSGTEGGEKTTQNCCGSSDIKSLMDIVFESTDNEIKTDQISSLTKNSARRSAVLTHLNIERSKNTNVSVPVFNNLLILFEALLASCTNEKTDISNFLSTMMMANTFFTKNNNNNNNNNNNATNTNASIDRSTRIYVKVSHRSGAFVPKVRQLF